MRDLAQLAKLEPRISLAVAIEKLAGFREELTDRQRKLKQYLQQKESRVQPRML